MVSMDSAHFVIFCRLLRMELSIRLLVEPRQNNSNMEKQLKASSGFEQFLCHVMCCMLFVFLAHAKKYSLIVTFALFDLAFCVEVNAMWSEEAW